MSDKKTAVILAVLSGAFIFVAMTPDLGSHPVLTATLNAVLFGAAVIYGLLSIIIGVSKP